jgi:hypothetical protein
LFGLTKNCAVCGIDIDKQVKFKRFGKYFCSEDDAEQYSKRNISGKISQGTNSRQNSEAGMGCACC